MQNETVPQSYNVDSEGDTIWQSWQVVISLPNTETDATSKEPTEQTDARAWQAGLNK